MSELTYDDVRKIIAMIEGSTVEELHVELGDFKLDVRRHGATAPSPAPAAPTKNTGAVSPPPAATLPVAPAPRPVGAPSPTELAPGQFAVVAPMLGTFYRAPAPDAPPFVDVGAQVAAGDPVCIIEVMKLMNTIAAPSGGRVAAILIDNAAMVEFGQRLIVFDPLAGEETPP